MGPRRRGQVGNNAASNASKAKPLVQQPSPPTSLPQELQQAILNVFRHAFPLADQGDLKPTIQEVKGHLYNRDFVTAFSKPSYLAAYALRWSAGRALCYAEVLSQLDFMQVQPVEQNVPYPPAHAGQPTLQQRSGSKAVCIGGGAGAEIVAFACALSASPATSKFDVTAVDIADWSSTLSSLRRALTTPPPLSAYASEAAKASNSPLITPELMQVEFIHQDILACEEAALQGLLQGVGLCTLMFTLNELFTSSIARTTAFLLALTDTMVPGAWLLVVDSPGSYSEIRLGKEQTPKQYPMKWLMDHVLLDAGAKGKWRKVVEDDSRWYRVEKGLQYPVELENMRYQIHLYQRQSNWQ